MATQTAYDVVASYAAAWRAEDEDERRALLERSWADDGVYCDPTAVIAGREALVEHIGGFLARMPGARIVATTGVDVHDGYLRFGWRMLDPEGNPALDGMDFGELGSDGRLKRIVGFFGDFPPG